MSTVDVGRIGERAAAKFLRKNRYRILDKNLHISHNEIDIIARNKTDLVFVEVKARCVDEHSINNITPSEAVTKQKQKRIITAARSYIAKYKKPLQPRFDVVEIFLDKETKKVIKINHIINAYGAR